MTNAAKTRTCFISILLLWTVASHAGEDPVEFDAFIIPSLMDYDMDAWYRVPRNSGPVVHTASSVTHGQMFMILAFFRGYSSDADNQAHLRYDVQIYGPDGKPTVDKADDMAVYRGPVRSSKVLLLNRDYLTIVFTDKYPLGTYTIKLTGYDKVAKKTIVREKTIELVPFAYGKPFDTMAEVNQWTMEYHLKPHPLRSLEAIRKSIQLNNEWLTKYINVPVFFAHVFKRNPFLVERIIEDLDTLSLDDKKKLLLVAVLGQQATLTTALLKTDGLEKTYTFVKQYHLPDSTTVVQHGAQLDMFWAEFLATGRYEPIKNIVRALALHQYEGSIEKFKTTKEADRTQQLNDNAYYEAVYQSAVWSLISNSKQMPQVFRYCVFIYQNETLDEDIKKQLAGILTKVQKDMKKERDKSLDKAS